MGVSFIHINLKPAAIIAGRRLAAMAIVFCIAFGDVKAQADTVMQLQAPRVMAKNIVLFSVDNLGNVYTVNTANQIKKLNAKGDSISVYNDVKRYGSIWSIDVSNPLKVLVYYRDFSTVIMLDRLLNVRNVIDLRKLDIFQPRAVCSSYDGLVWVYDELNARIRKIDETGRQAMESADLRQALPQAPQPVQMFDRDGQLYLFDTSRGLFVFDYYGAARNTLQLPGATTIQVGDKNNIIGFGNNSITVLQPKMLQITTRKLPLQLARSRQLQVAGNYLFELSAKGELTAFGMR